MKRKQPRVALREAREALNLSQRQAALQAGYTHSAAWCQIESGVNTPSLERMLAIARVVKKPAIEVFPELRDAIRNHADADAR